MHRRRAHITAYIVNVLGRPFPLLPDFIAVICVCVCRALQSQCPWAGWWSRVIVNC